MTKPDIQFNRTQLRRYCIALRETYDGPVRGWWDCRVRLGKHTFDMAYSVSAAEAIGVIHATADQVCAEYQASGEYLFKRTLAQLGMGNAMMCAHVLGRPERT